MSNSEITAFYLPGTYLDEVDQGLQCGAQLQAVLESGLEAFLDVSGDYIFTFSQNVSVYAHSSSYLWAFHDAALAAAALVSIIAIILTYRHGIPSPVGFSQFLIMTRNPALAQITEKAPLCAHQLTKDMRRMNLRFGKFWTRIENDEEVAGFAIDEVVPLRKPVPRELW